MSVRSFDELATVLMGRVAGDGWIGRTCAVACPACGGRLLFWTRRPGPWPTCNPGFRCADCGRRGDLVGLHLLVEKHHASAA